MNALAEWKLAAFFGVVNESIGFNFAAAGKKEAALDILERAFEQHDPNMPYIGVSVAHTTLRDEPRFQELLRGMNLPVSQ